MRRRWSRQRPRRPGVGTSFRWLAALVTWKGCSEVFWGAFQSIGIPGGAGPGLSNTSLRIRLQITWSGAIRERWRRRKASWSTTFQPGSAIVTTS